ncbi:MAG: TlyA family RNA methyltransferase [Chthoniobacterales bacterium]
MLATVEVQKAAKKRLDQLLVEKGYFDSREKAQRAVMAGRVFTEDRRMDKPGMSVAEDIGLRVDGEDRYVGRGGFKMEGALDGFGIDPTGLIALDIGASTGGFTDCLLQRGAAKVHAIDVGHNQLDWKIRSDPRVCVKEGINARNLRREDIGDKPDIVVIDVSFISLTLILPAAFEVLGDEGRMIVLIKPQFELSREKVDKGGIVKEAAYHEEAVEKIRIFVTETLDHQWMGVIPSPITGAAGNREFLAFLKP